MSVIDTTKWETQVRKGLLDYIVLSYLRKKEHYGYELVKLLKEEMLIEISEGTLYPLFKRLENNGFLIHKWENRKSGTPRKYYSITIKGIEEVRGMNKAWQKIKKTLALLD